VLVQTFCPESPAIAAATRHDYASFARHELPHREAHGYPPFTSLARIIVRGAKEAATRALADEIARRLRDVSQDVVRVLGPAAAPMAKLRGQHRVQIQLQSPDGERLRTVIRAATGNVKPPDGVLWTVDVDPWDMM